METLKVKKINSSKLLLSIKEYTIMQTFCIMNNIEYEVDNDATSGLSDGYIMANLTVEQINKLLEIIREVNGTDSDYLIL